MSRLRLGGLADYAALLGLTRHLLEDRWDELHPRLDPEDDNDPTLRANALLRLGHPGWVLRFLRDLPLAQSPRLGHYSWRDVGLATGPIPSEAADKPSETTIRAAFQDSDPARLALLREAAAAAAAEVAAISTGFDARAGAGAGPDLEELGKVLREMARAIERYAVVPAEAPAEASTAVAPGADGAVAVPAAAARGPALSAAA